MATLLSYALCSVADVKENLGITDSSRDNLIIRKINQATEMIEGYTGRRFASTVYTDEVYDGTGTNQLVLKQRPVTALTALKARSTSLNVNDYQTLDTQDYFLDANAGIISGISSFYGTWDRWAVTYTAGYATIPSDLAEACATLAAYLVNQSIDNSLSVDTETGETLGSVKRKTEGSRSVEYFNASESSSSSGSGAGAGSIIEFLNLDETLNRYSNTVISGLI